MQLLEPSPTAETEGPGAALIGGDGSCPASAVGGDRDRSPTSPAAAAIGGDSSCPAASSAQPEAARPKLSLNLGLISRRAFLG